jgi:hypothetical protein
MLQMLRLGSPGICSRCPSKWNAELQFPGTVLETLGGKCDCLGPFYGAVTVPQTG